MRYLHCTCGTAGAKGEPGGPGPPTDMLGPYPPFPINKLTLLKTADFVLNFKDLSAARPSGAEHRFNDSHDRRVDGSTSTHASLLRIWIRCFTTILSAWWNLTSSKLQKSEARFKRKTRKQGLLLSESGFVLCTAPPSLSRDRRIKMKKSNQNNQTFALPDKGLAPLSRLLWRRL